MAYFVKFFRALALLFAGTVLAACGEQGRGFVDVEAQHCRAAAKRLTRDVGDIQIIEAKAWTIGDQRNVRVRFSYPEHNEQGLTNGNLLCSYVFPVTVRGDNSRVPVAKSIYFRARNLSKNELLLLNMGLRGTRPEFKIK